MNSLMSFLKRFLPQKKNAHATEFKPEESVFDAVRRVREEENRAYAAKQAALEAVIKKAQPVVDMLEDVASASGDLLNFYKAGLISSMDINITVSPQKPSGRYRALFSRLNFSFSADSGFLGEESPMKIRTEEVYRKNTYPTDVFKGKIAMKTAIAETAKFLADVLLPEQIENLETNMKSGAQKSSPGTISALFDAIRFAQKESIRIKAAEKDNFPATVREAQPILNHMKELADASGGVLSFYHTEDRPALNATLMRYWDRSSSHVTVRRIKFEFNHDSKASGGQVNMRIKTASNARGSDPYYTEVFNGKAAMKPAIREIGKFLAGALISFQLEELEKNMEEAARQRQSQQPRPPA